jgi:hypothetical protein
MSTEVVERPSSVSAELQEKVLLGGDLARLTPAERLSYYNAVCNSVGLNPLTRPFEYLVLNEKMVLYARKDCTDQLRDIHGVSITIVAREVVDGVYVVTAQAKNMTERTDESVGAVPLIKENGEWRNAPSGKRYFAGDGTYKPMSPDDKANAMMKAETKAKRRVTLSICGLGMLDETELDTVPQAKVMEGARLEKPLPKGSEMLAKLEAKGSVLEPDVNDTPKEMGLPDQGTLDHPAPAASLCGFYSEQIGVSQSVSECSATLNAALKDATLTMFEVKQLQDEGKAKILALRAKKG